MHKSSTPSAHIHTHNGFFSKGSSIFGGSKTPLTEPQRPNTSIGLPANRQEPTLHTGALSETAAITRKTSVSSTTDRDSQTFTSIAEHPSLSPDKAVKVRTRARSSSASYRHRRAQELHRKSPYLTGISPPRRDTESQSRTSTDSYKQVVELAEGIVAPSSVPFSVPYPKMLARPATGYQSIGGANGTGPMSPTLETVTYQHIQEMASKRISTLDYLRKAHEGRVYWFNTLLFNKPDLQRMPYFDSRKLARRATNYLLLGLSLPTVLDLNGSNAQEFLRTLNALLAEFEAYQQIHPPDGSSSLSRGRFPQMFKRATTTSGKGRRTSSAADIGLPMGNDNDMKSTSGSSGAPSSATSFPSNETDLLPGEEYTYLLTPSLPFDPDFYETFATLCDVLIDCYTRLMSLVTSPKDCSPYLAELFTKADARVRKIIVQGVVKEFEDSSRNGVRSEVAGVGKVVLGGLM